MNSKISLSSGVLWLSGLSACLPNVRHGSGVELEQTRTVDAFSAVDAKGSIEVRLTVSADGSTGATVSGDDNLVPLVRTETMAGTLRINLNTRDSVRPSVPLVVTATTNALHGLRAAEDANVTANTVAGDDISVASSGDA